MVILQKKDRYIFPAFLTYDDDGISVEFPDLPGCFTCGSDTDEAIKNAKEAMVLHLIGMEQDSDIIPEPTSVEKLTAEKNQIITLIEVWMPLFRSSIENKAIKKTLTIPKWLDDLAKENKINFSYLLQEALKKKLGVEDYN